MDDVFARQQVLSRLASAELPEGVKAEMQPPYGPTGEIYRYTLRSKTQSIQELTAIQDWMLDKQFKSVPGVAEVNTFGGQQKAYEIAVNPYFGDAYRLDFYGRLADNTYRGVDSAFGIVVCFYVYANQRYDG